MSAYYFLASALPPLQIGLPPEMSFEAFVFLLKTNLKETDLRLIKTVPLYYDIKNMRAFWLNEKFDPHGFLDAHELEECLAGSIGFPDYIYDFLEKHKEQEERMRFLPQLISEYFRQEIAHSEGFLNEYLIFEREWRLVLTALRAKQMGRDLAEELRGEDSQEEFISQIIAQKDAPFYEPPSEYADLKSLFEAHRENPLALHRALYEYRFEKVEKMYGIRLFSIDRILAYMVQLILVERWGALDQEQGKQIAKRITIGKSA